jgi:hypothetical protein
MAEWTPSSRLVGHSAQAGTLAVEQWRRDERKRMSTTPQHFDLVAQAPGSIPPAPATAGGLTGVEAAERLARFGANWLLLASLFDIAVTIVMATQGWLMDSLSLAWIASLLGASIGYLVLGNAFRRAAAALIHRRRTRSPAQSITTARASGQPRPAGTH